MDSGSMIKKLKKILVLTVILIVGSYAMADESEQILAEEQLPVLTLEETIAKIKESNMDVLLADITRNQIVRESGAWFADYLPSIMLGGSFTGAGSLSNPESSPFSWDNKGAFSVGLDVSIDGTMFTNPYARTLAKESANLNYKMTVDDIIYSAVVSYWELSGQKLTIQQSKASAESAISTYQSTQEKYDNGLASSLTLSQSRLSAVTASVSYSKAVSDYETARKAFATLLGLDITTDFDVEDLPEVTYLDLPSAKEIYATYGESSDDIRKLNLAYQTSSVNKDRTLLNNTLPKLTAGAHYNAATGTSKDSMSVTIDVSLPLDAYIPNSNASLQIQAAEDAVLSSQISLSKGRDSYLKAIETARSTIESAERNIEYQKLSLEIASENLSLSQQSYDAGLLSASDLDKARDSKLTAEITLTEYKLVLLKAEYYLADAIGISLEKLKEKYGRTEQQ